LADKPHSAARTWARALGNIATLHARPGLTLPDLIAELAERFQDKTALTSPEGELSYRGLASRMAEYALWAKSLHVQPGQVVGLLLPNCLDYLPAWLGITQAGGVVALINTQLAGDALRETLQVAAASHLIFGQEFAPAVRHIRDRLPDYLTCWSVAGNAQAGALPVPFEGEPCLPGNDGVAAPPIAKSEGTALLIFTSGTTGLPKAVRVSHARIMEWSVWFAGMIDAGPDDILYSCLPMYHSTGGVAAIGAVLSQGGSIVLRPRFSAGKFWRDVADHGCTLFVYIGELCRYLADSPPVEAETRHLLRLCFGNGLRQDVWRRFEQRFAIPRILEFYAATEGAVALYNCEGRAGAVGRVPPFLAHRFPIALIASDVETGEAQRGADGFCVVCEPGTAGEAIGRISGGGAQRFEGYTDDAASERKILRNVLAHGDAWYRTGDRLRQDPAGFYEFIDRMGDTFRWKGENVSTVQVEDALCRCQGVTGAVVFGVSIPGTEGRAGMAALTVAPDFDLACFRRQVTAALPPYARPVFLRLCETFANTGTFKPIKSVLKQQGYAAELITDKLFIDDPEIGAYRAL
jgi:fatty-acyl-CoA synthase